MLQDEYSSLSKKGGKTTSPTKHEYGWILWCCILLSFEVLSERIIWPCVGAALFLTREIVQFIVFLSVG
ncbi:hypothetical protein K1719_042483 [Acacia pycnantha]|nr:hypothetical protein K1719_045916 [Acacia pycnantha]KAI9075577.1 hypothetical protein K1719_042483 [Acacia pycnantha]